MAKEDIRRETLCDMLNDALRKLIDPACCQITHVTWQERDENGTNWHYRAIWEDSATTATRTQVERFIDEAKEKYNIIEKRG